LKQVLRQIVLLVVLALSLSGCTANTEPAAATTATLSGCQPHIETHGAEFWAKELGRTEEWVLQNHRLTLWQNAGATRGAKVGELLPGSRAVVIEEAGDSYKVQSPLDKTVGWISKVQVARTLQQDVETRKSCTK